MTGSNSYYWIALLPRHVLVAGKLGKRSPLQNAVRVLVHRTAMAPGPRPPPFLPVLRAKPPEELRWAEQFTDRRAAPVEIGLVPVQRSAGLVLVC